MTESCLSHRSEYVYKSTLSPKITDRVGENMARGLSLLLNVGGSIDFCMTHNAQRIRR